MKTLKVFSIGLAGAVLACIGMYGAGSTTINSSRTVKGNLTVEGTCTGCGGGGALVRLSTCTATGASICAFTSVITSTYKDYQLEIIAYVPATNATGIAIQASTDNGANYDSTSGHYSTLSARQVNGTGANALCGTTTYICMDGGAGTDFISNSTSWGWNATIYIRDPLNATANKPFSTGNAHWLNSAASKEMANVFGSFDQATAMNAFKVFPTNAGTFTAVMVLYGLTQS